MGQSFSTYYDKGCDYYKANRAVCLTGGAVLLAATLLPGKKPARDADEPDCANFNSFIKGKAGEEEHEFIPSNFNTFIKPAGSSMPAPGRAAPPPAAKAAAAAKTGSTGVAVLFGTEYGFSKEIAQKLVAQLASHSVHARLLDMSDHPQGLDLSAERALLVACSTQGDGVPPTEAREFVEWLDKGCGALNGVPFSVLALGDTSYTHFCACGKRIDARLEALGGKRLYPRVDVDKEDWPVVDGWIEGVVGVIQGMGIKTEAPPAAAAAQNGHALSDITTSAVANGAPPSKKKYSRASPYLATVTRVQGLCTVASAADKDTVLIELDLGDSGLEYLPGDALGVVPRNCPSAVKELLAVWGADPALEVPTPSWKGQVNGSVASAASLTLRAALASCYDIRQPKPEIFNVLLKAYEKLAAAGGDAPTADVSKQLEELKSLAGTGEEAGKAREAYLAPRHLVDVLRAFAAARPEPQAVLGALRQLQARLYSISSSMRENPRRVQITVATVKYEQLGAERIGVCSTFVAERAEVGSQVPIFVSKNPDFRLPKDPMTPIVMVGPGTGLAPFRSFMADRTLSGAQCGESMLFFGCRRRDQDYLYGSQLESWDQSGALKLVTAFSREGKKKVYVQDRLREHADHVWQLLERGAHFYVCGDANSMAGAVEEALLDLIQARVGEGATRGRAQEYLEGLRKAERYQRDVWFS